VLNAASAVSVNATNGTLAGTGIINGPVTVNAGGTLAPGTSAIGTLTISNNLTLNGNLLFKVQKGVSQSNDIASVSGTLANGGTGTLTVMNLGPAFVVGDKFYLFNKLMTGGGSLTVTGGGSGVTWNNNLATEGSISVASITVAKPVITNIVINSSSTSMVFSGTNATANANYYVLYQTNLTKPLSAWIPVYTNAFLTSGAFSVTVTNSVLLRDTNQFFIFELY
jgi:hypothetical protein